MKELLFQKLHSHIIEGLDFCLKNLHFFLNLNRECGSICANVSKQSHEHKCNTSRNGKNFYKGCLSVFVMKNNCRYIVGLNRCTFQNKSRLSAVFLVISYLFQNSSYVFRYKLTRVETQCNSLQILLSLFSVITITFRNHSCGTCYIIHSEGNLVCKTFSRLSVLCLFLAWLHSSCLLHFMSFIQI